MSSLTGESIPRCLNNECASTDFLFPTNDRDRVVCRMCGTVQSERFFQSDLSTRLHLDGTLESYFVDFDVQPIPNKKKAKVYGSAHSSLCSYGKAVIQKASTTLGVNDALKAEAIQAWHVLCDEQKRPHLKVNILTSRSRNALVVLYIICALHEAGPTIDSFVQLINSNSSHSLTLRKFTQLMHKFAKADPTHFALDRWKFIRAMVVQYGSQLPADKLKDIKTRGKKYRPSIEHIIETALNTLEQLKNASLNCPAAVKTIRGLLLEKKRKKKKEPGSKLLIDASDPFDERKQPKVIAISLLYNALRAYKQRGIGQRALGELFGPSTGSIGDTNDYIERLLEEIKNNQIAIKRGLSGFFVAMKQHEHVEELEQEL